MSDALRELYQEIILDHARHPRHSGPLAGATSTAEGNNPLCGDKIKIYVKRDKDQIAMLSFEGRGCAISQASASLMAELVQGRSTKDADKLMQSFLHLVKGEPAPELSEEERESLEVMAGVQQFPMRVKCATLAWHTMKAALEGAGETTTENDGT
jgi:nitrogen fixation NifU-like protein